MRSRGEYREGSKDEKENEVKEGQVKGEWEACEKTKCSAAVKKTAQFLTSIRQNVKDGN